MDLNNFFSDLNDTLYSKEMELAAIIMERAVVTGNKGRVNRLYNGHEVRVENGAIVDCSPDKPATHRIVRCYGTVSSSKLGFTLVDINSNEPLNLKVQ